MSGGCISLRALLHIGITLLILMDFLGVELALARWLPAVSQKGIKKHSQSKYLLNLRSFWMKGVKTEYSFTDTLDSNESSIIINYCLHKGQHCRFYNYEVQFFYAV